jgi:hypothetical protein
MTSCKNISNWGLLGHLVRSFYISEPSLDKRSRFDCSAIDPGFAALLRAFVSDATLEGFVLRPSSVYDLSSCEHIH